MNNFTKVCSEEKVPIRGTVILIKESKKGLLNTYELGKWTFYLNNKDFFLVNLYLWFRLNRKCIKRTVKYVCTHELGTTKKIYTKTLLNKFVAMI